MFDVGVEVSNVVACQSFSSMFAEGSDGDKATRAHIGSHPLVLKGLLEHPSFWTALSRTAVSVKAMQRRVPAQASSMQFVAWDALGEKWAVAFAVVLFHSLRAVGFREGVIHNLCDWRWGSTCRGICHACRDYTSDGFFGHEGRDVLKMAVARFVRDFEGA